MVSCILLITIEDYITVYSVEKTAGLLVRYVLKRGSWFDLVYAGP